MNANRRTTLTLKVRPCGSGAEAVARATGGRRAVLLPCGPCVVSAREHARLEASGASYALLAAARGVGVVTVPCGG